MPWFGPKRGLPCSCCEDTGSLVCTCVNDPDEFSVSIMKMENAPPPGIGSGGANWFHNKMITGSISRTAPGANTWTGVFSGYQADLTCTLDGLPPNYNERIHSFTTKKVGGGFFGGNVTSRNPEYHPCGVSQCDPVFILGGGANLDVRLHSESNPTGITTDYGISSLIHESISRKTLIPHLAPGVLPCCPASENITFCCTPVVRVTITGGGGGPVVMECLPSFTDVYAPPQPPEIETTLCGYFAVAGCDSRLSPGYKMFPDFYPIEGPTAGEERYLGTVAFIYTSLRCNPSANGFTFVVHIYQSHGDDGVGCVGSINNAEKTELIGDGDTDLCDLLPYTMNLTATLVDSVETGEIPERCDEEHSSTNFTVKWEFID